MTSQSDFGRRAYGLLQSIVNEIGPRPAGGDGEAKFLDFAEGFFADRGIGTQREAVPNVPLAPARLPLLIAGAAGLLAATWGLPDQPWWIWIYAVGFSVVPDLVVRVQRRVQKSGATGYNLIATISGKRMPERTLILCAHHDTARASRIPNPRLAEWARQLMELFPAITLGLGILAIVRFLDKYASFDSFVPYSWWILLRDVLFGMLVVWALFVVGYSVLSSGKQFSPGANDNGSGVAVLMAAAETLARDPLEHVQVNFIFFSAEENGLLGSKQYVKEFRSELDGATVLNLDMVGSGERISFVTGAGLLTPRRTSRRLNKQLTHLKPGIRGRWYWMGNSDFYSFLSKRIAAASLEASGKGRENVYHTEKDTMDYVEPQLLGEAFDLVLAFARAVDRAEDDA